MMKQEQTLPLTALAGGAAALVVRFWNRRAGFEDATGLPVPGHISFTVLLILLAAVCAALWILSRDLSADGNPRFPFRTARREPLAVAVAGAFVLALSGLADLFEGLTGDSLSDFFGGGSSWQYRYEYGGMIAGGGVEMSAGAKCAAGVLTLLSAWAVLDCVRACRKGAPRSRVLVMIPAVALSFRLVSLYRIDSVNPVLQDYAPVLVAFVLHTLGFYSFAAFSFELGSLRQYAFSTCAATAFTLCVLFDGADYVSTPLTLVGSALSLMGFLPLSLTAPRVKPAPPPEQGK